MYEFSGKTESAADRIIHITRPAQIGGTITTTLRQAELQHLDGINVRLWSMLQTQQDQLKAIIANSPLCIKQISLLGLALRATSLQFWLGRSIVHFHSGQGCVTNRQRWLRRLLHPDIALVVTLHGTVTQERQFCDPYWRRYHIDNAKFVGAIGVPSESERRMQIEIGLPAEKVFVIPDVITHKKGDPKKLRLQLGLTETERILLYCGRVVREKGTYCLIEAFASIANRYPDVTLVVAGNGPDLQRCQQAAVPLGGRVRFLGHVANVDDLYAAADVFAAPSTGESFGISAMEAALARVPMMITKIEPWTDVFADGVSCEFVKVNDVASMVSALIRLFDHPQRSLALADNACMKVQSRFAPDCVLAALDRFYACAAKNRFG